MTYKDPSYPKISIVTPSYNQAGFLEKTILSVLNQNYPDFEYMIIDGGSTDNSVKIIKKYEKYLKFWISEPDKGQSHAINKGFEHATGDLFAWINSDDYYMPGALQTVADLYRKYPDAGAFVGRGRKVNHKGKVVYEPEFKQVDNKSLFRWSYNNNFMQPSCLFTKKAWEDCGPLDESLHIAFDLDFWINISMKYRFQMLDALLSESLQHAKAKTTFQRNLMFVDFAFVYIKHGGIEYARELLNDRAEEFTRLEKRYERIRRLTGARLFIGCLDFLKRTRKCFFSPDFLKRKNNNRDS
jgi:glycosyltransferase involved in cell wall biosynthesis